MLNVKVFRYETMVIIIIDLLCIRPQLLSFSLYLNRSKYRTDAIADYEDEQYIPCGHDQMLSKKDIFYLFNRMHVWIG